MSITSPTGGGSIENPEFSIPFTFDFGNNDVQYVEQDSDVDVANRIWTVLSYEPGMLIVDPNFGVQDQTFKKGGADLDVIRQAIERYVPGANELIERDPNWLTTLIDTIQIREDTSGNA